MITYRMSNLTPLQIHIHCTYLFHFMWLSAPSNQIIWQTHPEVRKVCLITNYLSTRILSFLKFLLFFHHLHHTPVSLMCKYLFFPFLFLTGTQQFLILKFLQNIHFPSFAHATLFKNKNKKKFFLEKKKNKNKNKMKKALYTLM